MGYSVNPSTVERRRKILENLERGVQTAWVLNENDPVETQRYAYEIREALYIASLYPERFPALAKAHKEFSIHVIRPGRIEARRKAGDGDVQISGLPHGRPTPLIGLNFAAEFIDSWKSHLPSNDALHFTQVDLKYEELFVLYNWATSWKPRLMILYDDGSKRLTLSLVDPTVEEFAWRPAPTAAPIEEHPGL